MKRKLSGVLLVAALTVGAVWFLSNEIEATSPGSGSEKRVVAVNMPDFQYIDETQMSGGAYNPSKSPAQWIKTATKNWMKSLDDSTPIKNISLPGTHDSASRFGGAAAEAQTWTIQDQLDAGIRFLDIRTRTMKDGLAIHHGDFYQNQNFNDIMKTVSGFLQANPTEAIVMRVKKDEDTPGNGGEDTTDKSPFYEHWDAYMTTYDSFVAGSKTSEVTLKDLRGKVLILRDGFEGVSKKGMRYDNSTFDIQDRYKVYFLLGDGLNGSSANLPGKKKVIKLFLDRAASSSQWVLNYLSGSTGMIPSDVARATNATAYDHIGSKARKRKLGTVIMDFPGEQLIYRIIKSNFLLNMTGYALQTGTSLPEGGDFTFLLAPSPFDLLASRGVYVYSDLFAIKKTGTGSRTTEVHVLSAASNYKSFILRTGTALQETGANMDFVLAPNRDLVAILKSGTGSRSTEVHVLSAASNYQRFILQTGTALPESGANFSFAMGPNRDLFAIKKSNTGSKSTEVHVLSAASNYQQFTLQTKTALGETDASYEFVVAKNKDLFVIKKSNTGSKSTEVHVLSAASNYANFILHTGTVLAETDSSYTFGITTERDLFVIKKRNTGTKSTEIHIVDLP